MDKIVEIFVLAVIIVVIVAPILVIYHFVDMFLLKRRIGKLTKQIENPQQVVAQLGFVHKTKGWIATPTTPEGWYIVKKDNDKNSLISTSELNESDKWQLMNE